MESEPPPPKGKGQSNRQSKAKAKALDDVLRSQLIRISGVDFTAIDGMGVLTVQTILAEVGLAPTRFGTAKQFASWLGLAPECNIGGKRKDGRTRKVKSRVANAFRLAALAAQRT